MEKKAVALKYDFNKDQAPKVVAKGEGLLAERILALAKEHGIPVKKDDKLIEALMKLEVHQEIPPDLYEAVAIVLAWAWRLNEQS
ncbi:type III secretion exporter [Thermodesulfatator indicus DSM 15286]|uniref:Type III secretion exporter n=1 Tax=Thermodesulfatator indicus (strain DSM 15286 / JCM 11887 / CIR29812) TaxID=667014 RepID=F8A9B3_THEID|nr:EscU/YscU/HrcU family type III secretion system export apparatus switch protein [Thermodesulfatator indicus]AEH45559.1 type III secretion exporter [Thermodesulfatator indicus DSM 15286]